MEVVARVGSVVVELAIPVELAVKGVNGSRRS